MKGQSAFITDNISAISKDSRQYFIHNPTNQPSEFHPDSTDNLVEEILMQRAERLKNQQAKLQQRQTKKSERGQIDLQQQEIEQVHKQAEQKQQQQLAKLVENESNQEFQSVEKLNNHSKGTIKQSSLRDKQSSHHIEDHIDTLHNQTNQYYQHQDPLSNRQNQPNIVDNQIDHINNHSISQHPTPSEKSLQLNLSLSPSQKKNSNNGPISNHQQADQERKENENSSKIIQKSHIQANQQNIGDERIQPSKVNPSNSLSHSSSKKMFQNPNSNVKSSNSLKSSNNQHSRQPSHKSNSSKPPTENIVKEQQLNISNRLEKEMAANQSKIQVKNSLIISPINIYTERQQLNDFTPIPKKTETDMELVKAITDHLNTIEYQQVSEQRTFRKSQRTNNIAQNVIIAKKESSQVENVHYAEQFQTDHSQHERETKIMQHRLESNMLFEIGQLKEMIALYQALILNEECKESVKEIKDLQMKNRREKIALRSASYSKRFNFHSPITKNNNQPIQFRTKFVISPRLAGRYHEVKKGIEDQNKLQGELQQKYTVLGDYYEMMKQKKIQVQIEGLTEYQYNSRIQKFETVRGNFFKKEVTPASEKPSQYEFNKSKRTLSIEENEITYYQVLKYKLEIGKDMMLQYQVWNLGKLKKLKDQNILIKKQIEYVNKKIQDIDRELLNIFGVRSVKSTSRSKIQSPNITNRIGSPVKSQTRFGSPKTPQQNIINSSFKDYDCTTSNKKKKADNQLLLLESVKMDPLKRKSMQILEKIDDYGMSAIEEESKIIEDNPTLVKKKSKLIIPKPKEQTRSKSKNLVRTRSKQVRTEAEIKSIGSKKSKDLRMSQHTSPKKVKTQSQYYTSMEQIYSKQK